MVTPRIVRSTAVHEVDEFIGATGAPYTKTIAEVIEFIATWGEMYDNASISVEYTYDSCDVHITHDRMETQEEANLRFKYYLRARKRRLAGLRKTRAKELTKLKLLKEKYE